MPGYSIDDWFTEKIKDLRSEILQETEEQIVGTDTEELANYYFSKSKVNIVEFDGDSSMQHKKGIETIPSYKREAFYQSLGDLENPYEDIIIKMPIKYNADIAKIADYRSSPGFINNMEKDFNWQPNEISFSLRIKGYYINLDEDTIKVRIERSQHDLQELIRMKNENIERGNSHLRQEIINLINGRKKEIEEDNRKFESLIKKINIPLEENEALQTKRISLQENTLAKAIKPNPNIPEEYTLDEIHLTNLLELFDNQAKSFENTPKTFSRLEEEELRDILLSNLNSIYAGKATGETFSKKGKTDIYLNINKGNILVFECKFWKGEAVFNETIDQIRGYLTWHHNYAVVVFFVKQKDFMNILSQIPDLIKKSDSYKGDYKEIAKEHFISKNIIDDSGKEVKIHFLFYNLYYKE